MIRVKDGVSFAVVAPAGWMILGALKATSKQLAVDLTITSGCDGVHSGPGDPHHTGEAYDVRSHDLTTELRPIVLDSVLSILGRDHFFGFLEDAGSGNEHFHFQRKKGTTFTLQEFLAV